MDSTIDVDFNGEAGPLNADFRRFVMILEVCYSQRQPGNAMPAFGHLFKNLVTTLREGDGAISCAGGPSNLRCNKSNIVFLICNITSEVPDVRLWSTFCEDHARTRSVNRNKPILYIIVRRLYFNHLRRIQQRQMSMEEDHLLIEEDDDI